MDLHFLMTKLGISQSLAQDLTLVLVIVVISLVSGVLIGRYKLISILINMYISVALLGAGQQMVRSVMPDSNLTDYTYQLGFFFVCVIVLTLVSKSLFEIYITGSGSGLIRRVFIMSFLEVTFLVSIVLSIVPKKVALGYVSVTSYRYLALPDAHFVWMVVPLVFLSLIHKRLNK
jgi:uncharacterized membrane protein required for colicin V production